MILTRVLFELRHKMPCSEVAPALTLEYASSDVFPPAVSVVFQCAILLSIKVMRLVATPISLKLSRIQEYHVVCLLVVYPDHIEIGFPSLTIV